MFNIYDFNPEIYHSENYLVLDLETTNKNYGDATTEENRLLLAVWSFRGVTKYKWGNSFEQYELLDDIKKADFIVAHNAKFELKWLKRCGLDLTKVLPFCTMIAEYVLQGNTSRMNRLGLGVVAPMYGAGIKDRYIDLSFKAGICPSECPRSDVLRRCKKDVKQTEKIFKSQRVYLQSHDSIKTLYTRCILTPCLADIEFNGMCLDEARVNAEYTKVERELNDVTVKINEFTGGINPNSPKQMAEFLYEKLGFKPLKDSAGNDIISASADTLKQLKPKNKRQKEFLELKAEQSLLNARMVKSLKAFKRCIDDNAYLTANFNQTVTRTHRLSSTGSEYSVQFQNLPRVYKPLFKARHKDWYIGEIDGAQLEFRVAAFLGQDPQAFYDITHEVDIHSFTAQTLTEAGQETNRQGAKEHTFKPLFGGMSGTDAEKTYYKAFQNKYSKIYNTQEAWVLEALRTKKLQLVSGLWTFWPNCRRTRTGYIQESSKIYNLPVQSLATADIIPIAVVGLWHEMKQANLKSFLVNTVHDSAIAEISPDEVLQFQDMSVRNFSRFVYTYLQAVYGIKFNVPLGAGLKVGRHWSEGESSISNYIYTNGSYTDCVLLDGGELKYTPECPFEFEEAL